MSRYDKKNQKNKNTKKDKKIFKKQTKKTFPLNHHCYYNVKLQVLSKSVSSGF